MSEILINCALRERRIALIENGAMQEIFVERVCASGFVGNVYLGKVVSSVTWHAKCVRRHRA